MKREMKKKGRINSSFKKEGVGEILAVVGGLLEEGNGVHLY